MAAVINPRGAHDCDGVPDGDGSYTYVLTDHTETTVPAVILATTGTLAVAGVTVHPNIGNLYELTTSIGGNTTGSTIGWTGYSGAMSSNVNTNFNASRCVGIRARMYPTSQLSTMNGRFLCARWPKGIGSGTETTSCAPTTIDAIAKQTFVKEGTANDPDQEGITMFWCPSRVNSTSGAVTAMSSFQWNTTAANYNNNEGFTMLWQGVGAAGAVTADMAFKVEIDSLWECQIPATAFGLWNGNVNYGDLSILALALEKLARIEASSSIYFNDASPEIRMTMQGRRGQPAPTASLEVVENARMMRMLRHTLMQLSQANTLAGGERELVARLHSVLSDHYRQGPASATPVPIVNLDSARGSLPDWTDTDTELKQ